MTNTIQIPSDISSEDLLRFLRKSADKEHEDNKGNLELTFDDTTIILNYQQKNDVAFIKSMMMSLIILKHDIDFNLVTEKYIPKDKL